MQTDKVASSPFQGLAPKLETIRRFYLDSIRYPSVRDFAEKISMSPTLGRTDIKAAFANLRAVLRYVPDPVGVELIKAPWEMVRQIQAQGWVAGDCDDFASFGYCLLHSLGLRAELAVGWYNSPNPSHIWLRVPMKSGEPLDFDLCAPRLGVTKVGASEVRTYE